MRGTAPSITSSGSNVLIWPGSKRDDSHDIDKMIKRRTTRPSIIKVRIK